MNTVHLYIPNPHALKNANALRPHTRRIPVSFRMVRRYIAMTMGRTGVMTALPIARKRLSIGTVTQFVMLNKAMPDVLRIRKMRIYPDPPIWEG